MTLLDIEGGEYEFEEIDIFRGKHQESEYLEKNPLGTIPMIVDNDNVVLGSTSILINYLTLSKSKLHSYRPKEHSNLIDQHLNWFNSVLQPCVQRLTKVIVGPKAFG